MKESPVRKQRFFPEHADICRIDQNIAFFERRRKVFLIGAKPNLSSALSLHFLYKGFIFLYRTLSL